MVDHEMFKLIVDQKGDIVKDPMKSISFVPKTIPGVGGVGWVMYGGDVSCRGGSCRAGVCHVGGGVGWVDHAGMGWVM